MAVQQLIVVLFGVLLIVEIKPTISEVTSNITIPGCPESCGSVKIPYPFGTIPGCYF